MPRSFQHMSVRMYIHKYLLIEGWYSGSLTRQCTYQHATCDTRNNEYTNISCYYNISDAECLLNSQRAVLQECPPLRCWGKAPSGDHQHSSLPALVLLRRAQWVNSAESCHKSGHIKTFERNVPLFLVWSLRLRQKAHNQAAGGFKNRSSLWIKIDASGRFLSELSHSPSFTSAGRFSARFIWGIHFDCAISRGQRGPLGATRSRSRAEESLTGVLNPRRTKRCPASVVCSLWNLLDFVITCA